MYLSATGLVINLNFNYNDLIWIAKIQIIFLCSKLFWFARLAEEIDLEESIIICIFASENIINCKKMTKESFIFHVQNLAFGWCRVLMLINDKEISFNAEYTGPNPLASLIDACAVFLDGETDCHVVWLCHDNELDINMEIDNDNMLHLDITDQVRNLFANDKRQEIYQEWHETIPLEDFFCSLVTESYRVLDAFGIYGYYRSWQDHVDFPLANLLRISCKIDELWKGDSCTSNISEEIECIREFVEKRKVTTKERELDWCTVYYESWQIQCCGEPFSVGEKIEWTCCIPRETKDAHGIIIDFEEEHHGFPTHTITGTVSKIIAERSEFPKGLREIRYEKADIIREELHNADGWEREFKDDDETERSFWGYIVELRDAFIKPIERRTKENEDVVF